MPQKNMYNKTEKSPKSELKYKLKLLKKLKKNVFLLFDLKHFGLINNGNKLPTLALYLSSTMGKNVIHNKNRY